MDGFKAGLPFFAQQIPPERNPITGEPITYPPGWGPDMISPIYMTQQGDDPVFREIFANRVSLAPVPRVTGGKRPEEGARLTEPSVKEGLRLTPGERDFWIVQMTQEVRDGRGRTLHEALADLVASESYQTLSTGPDGRRAWAIKAVYGAYRDKAEGVLLDPERGSPNLQRDLRTLKENRAKLDLRTTDPRSPQHPANQPPERGGLLRGLLPSLGR